MEEIYKTVVIHTRSTYWTNNEGSEESVVDADDLAKEIQNQSNELHRKGYEVINILPVNSGNMSHGTGYLQSESIIITAKKFN